MAILYNFPSNPTGGNVNPEQRDELVEFAKRNDLWIISDEVYDRIVYDVPHVSFIGAGYDKVIMVQSFSKTFAMTGWRIGYLSSPDQQAMEQLTKMQYYVTARSNDAMQHAVLEALENAPDYPDSMRSEFKKPQGPNLSKIECYAWRYVPHSNRRFLRFPQGRCPRNEQ